MEEETSEYSSQSLKLVLPLGDAWRTCSIPACRARAPSFSGRISPLRLEESGRLLEFARQRQAHRDFAVSTHCHGMVAFVNVAIPDVVDVGVAILGEGR